ncbi:MAG: hypothetical protein AVO34_01660 [Firmicutes bacterium ML8_F2]|jgi:hypothetical protein|nr:MAG: hypothetical protein AVO34_01660 [Firmicutes bacterium ML8_F2]
MKISKDLPQFDKKKTLIVVASKQKGKFYFAHKGEIKKLKYFRFRRPKHSDREGFFIARGKAGVYSRGAVYEPKKERIMIELVNRLEKCLKEILIKEKIDQIYLTCPEYLKNRIKSTFPYQAERKIKLFLPGNYYDFHPFDLLEKINSDKIRKKPSFPIKKEAAKIIKKSKLARKVIKGK